MSKSRSTPAQRAERLLCAVLHSKGRAWDIELITRAFRQERSIERRKLDTKQATAPSLRVVPMRVHMRRIGNGTMHSAACCDHGRGLDSGCTRDCPVRLAWEGEGCPEH